MKWVNYMPVVDIFGLPGAGKTTLEGFIVSQQSLAVPVHGGEISCSHPRKNPDHWCVEKKFQTLKKLKRAQALNRFIRLNQRFWNEVTNFPQFVSPQERDTFVSYLKDSATRYQLGLGATRLGHWRVDSEGLTQRLLSFCQRTDSSYARFFYDLYPKPDVFVYLECSPRVAATRRLLRFKKSGRDVGRYDDDLLLMASEQLAEMAIEAGSPVIRLQAGLSVEHLAEELNEGLSRLKLEDDDLL